jgi:hypothetical protein
MINTFLKAKHWQLFLLIFALPFVIYIGWLISFFTDFIGNIDYYESSDFPAELFNGIIYMVLLMMIPLVIQYIWFWSMAMGLQKKLPVGMKMKTGLFKAFFIIPIVYGLLYLLFMVSFFGSIDNLGNLENLENLDVIGDSQLVLFIVALMFFLGLSLFVTFCTFYQYWFIAKTIKSAELQKDAKFSEFVGEFFLVWFYPIGVWILQPTINKLVAEDTPELK